MFQIVFLGIIVATVIITVIKSVVYVYTTLGASTTLHNKVFKAVLACPMSFFDTTPTGRVLNRYESEKKTHLSTVKTDLSVIIRGS